MCLHANRVGEPAAETWTRVPRDPRRPAPPVKKNWATPAAGPSAKTKGEGGAGVPATAPLTKGANPKGRGDAGEGAKVTGVAGAAAKLGCTEAGCGCWELEPCAERPPGPSGYPGGGGGGGPAPAPRSGGAAR